MSLLLMHYNIKVYVIIEEFINPALQCGGYTIRPRGPCYGDTIPHR